MLINTEFLKLPKTK